MIICKQAARSDTRNSRKKRPSSAGSGSDPPELAPRVPRRHDAQQGRALRYYPPQTETEGVNRRIGTPYAVSSGAYIVPIQLRSATLLGVGHCVSETEDIGSRGTGWEARAGNPSPSQPRSGGACGPPGSRCASLHQFSSLLFGKNSCFYRLRPSRHSALTASLRLSANSRSHTQCAPAPVALHS